MKKIMFMFIIVLFFSITAPIAQANLILNESFETIGATWTYNNVDWVSGWADDKDGNVSIDLNGSGAGWISQSFATDVGNQYAVSFWLAGNPQGGLTLKTMHVSAGDVSDQQFTFDVTGHTIDTMGWTQKSFSFHAIATTTTLKFEGDVNGGAYGPAIDLVNVDLTNGASVPEPTSMLLLGLGLIGLAGVRRMHK